MNYQLLFHCANPRCAKLIYLSESVLGLECPDLTEEYGRRYCVDCAHDLGHLTAADVERLETLLREAGLYGRLPGPVYQARPAEVVRASSRQLRFQLS